MTRFEQIGVELQSGCRTIDQAAKTFNYSCTLCVTRGVKVLCDRCAIAIAHQQVCALLLDAEEEKYAEAMNQLQSGRKVCHHTPNKRTHVSGKHRTTVWRADD